MTYQEMISLMTGTPADEVAPYVLTPEEVASLAAQDAQIAGDEAARARATCPKCHGPLVAGLSIHPACAGPMGSFFARAARMA